jgi:hypothetical protein
MVIARTNMQFPRLIIATFAVFLAVTIAAVGTVWWLRQEAIETANRDDSNLAAILAGQISNSIDEIERVVDETQTKLLAHEGALSRTALSAKSTQDLILHQLSQVPGAAFIGIIDRRGIIASTTQRWPIPEIDVSYTPHFQHFISNPDDPGVYVSKLQVGKLYTGRVVIFSKRLVGPHDGFNGIIAVAVSSTYFQKSYEAISRRNNHSSVPRPRDQQLRSDAVFLAMA